MKIHAIGGYSEVGKNMTCVEVGEDFFIFDMGLYLPPIVELEEKENRYNSKILRDIKAIPDDTVISNELKSRTRAILIGHAHLDHVGAVPYIAPQYRAGIYGTPFTIAVLRRIMDSEEIRLKNPLHVINSGSHFFINGKNTKYKIEFVTMTHSTIQTVMIALHTPKGVFLYANDFKFDNTPILGPGPDWDKLKELGKLGVKALVVDSLYADDERKTPSEKVARGLLEDVLLTTNNSNSLIIVSTFSSHIARLKSIVDFGRKLKRKIVFAGRSLEKYVSAAVEVKMCPFQKEVQIAKYRNQVNNFFKKINSRKKEYLVVCTGHQGEPDSVLDKISRDKTPLQLAHGDHVIFASKVIPTEINIANRANLDKRLKARGVRIFDNVHVSGHAGREDLRDFIDLVRPVNIIPAHGDIKKLSALADLAGEMGYKLGKNCHILQNGQSVVV
ncbi:MAG: RNase J family beta-CASP ribonuclease [Nanoarchaeota archaeon]